MVASAFSAPLVGAEPSSVDNRSAPQLARPNHRAELARPMSVHADAVAADVAGFV